MRQLAAFLKQYPVPVFILLWGLLYFSARVWQSLPLHPQSLHISAQCDRASIARNFYEDDMNIWLPHMSNLVRGQGIAVAELPLIPYLAACCYKVFGFHNFWYRFIVFLFFSIGFIYTWKLARLLLNNEFTAMAVSFLWLASPTLLYYIPNFNPDPASLGLTMMAWYHFFALQQKYSPLRIILIGLLAALAIMLKASSAISFIAMGGLVVIDQIGWLTSNKKKIIPARTALFATLVLAGLIAQQWYAYAGRINDYYYSVFFTLYTRTPQNLAHLLKIWNNLKDVLLLHYYPDIIRWLIVIFLPLSLLLHKYIVRQLLLLTWTLTAGTLGFVYLMFEPFEHHDYYIIALLPVVFFLFAAIASGVTNYIGEAKGKWIAALLTVALGVSSYVYCFQKIGYLYDKNQPVFYEQAFQAYPEIEPLLRNAGIKRNDAIVSMMDGTYSVSLYLMNQKGYTIQDRQDINKIFQLICTRHAKYLITNSDNCLPDLPVITEFLGKPIITFKNLKVYKPATNDTALTNRIHQVIHQHIQLIIDEFKLDKKWINMNENYSQHCGIPWDAVEDDSGLYLFKVKDQELQASLKQFALEKYQTDSITPAILENYCATTRLSDVNRHVVQHPYASWYNNF